MKPIANALSTLKPASSIRTEPLAREVVEAVFERLRAQLGERLADTWHGVDPQALVDEWAAALADLHPSELARGLKVGWKTRFAPSLGEFRMACRPGLDPAWAWVEAGEGLRAHERGEPFEWSHPAVWRAAGRHAWEVRRGQEQFKASRVSWSFTLDQEYARGWLRDVTPPVARVARKEAPVGPPDEKTRARIAELLGAAKAGAAAQPHEEPAPAATEAPPPPPAEHVTMATAFRLGCEACAAGKKREENPYTGTQPGTHWDRGWDHEFAELPAELQATRQ